MIAQPEMISPATVDQRDPARSGPPAPVMREGVSNSTPADQAGGSGQNPDSRSNFSQATRAMLPEEISGAGANNPPIETPGACENILTLFDGGIGRPPDEDRIKEANRRQQILKTFDDLTKPAADGGSGMSKTDAVKQIGVGYATLWRWARAFAKKGYAGLIPDTANCGRHDVFTKLGMSAEEVEAIRSQLQGLNLDLKSTTQSLRLFANSDQCPEALARIILDPTRCSKHALPPSLRAAAKVPEPARQAHEGPRALSLRGIYTPRKIDVLPGDVFSADDTTPIWAWWIPWVESEDYPFGVKLLQGQFIPVIDVASQCVINFVLIAREKSSYRASDIWKLFGHTFDTIGLPRLGWQLERGSWEANIIRGQEIEYRENEVSYSRRVGGLRQLPANLTDWHRQKLGGAVPQTLQTITSYLPKSKSIEAALNRLQTFEGTLWGGLGRDQMRRPFEKMKKLFQQCSRPRAQLDPRNYFLSGEEIARRILGLINYMNSEPMEGEVFKGVPKLNFDSAVAEHPLWKLPDDLRWLYRSDWATGPKGNPLRITSGYARVRLTDPAGDRYSLFYTNPEVFAKYEGEPIAVYYDRENFEQPAQIILARTGEFLCEAQYEDRVGSFLEGDRSGHDVRKRWRNAVMSIYGTAVKHSPSRQLPPEIAARRVESRSSAAAAAASTQTVDGRPAAAPQQQRPNPFLPATPAQLAKQQNRVSRQAAHAKRLLTLGGEE